MYHSYLIINTGGNPDRPRPGRQWISNIYSVHQRLSMAFPLEQKIIEDNLFLNPFDPSSFNSYSEIKSTDDKINKSSGRFLFRIDNVLTKNESLAIIFVQSVKKPNWEYAFKNAKHLLADLPIKEPWIYDPKFSEGQILRFRIIINLSKKSIHYDKTGKKRNFNEIKSQNQGKRVALTWASGENKEVYISNWFSNKVKPEESGFKPIDIRVSNIGWVYGKKYNKSTQSFFYLKFRTALIEGKLIVEDPLKFYDIIQSGIGSGKAFGMGLLSVK